MHRGKIARFALDMKAEGMPLPNPSVDGANDFPLLLSKDSGLVKAQAFCYNRAIKKERGSYMSLFEQWKKEIEDHVKDERDQQTFWKAFCDKEKGIYEDLLGKKEAEVTGTVAGFAEKYGMTVAEIMGFLDGISESLENEAPVLDEMTEESEFDLKIDFEKLYWNMLAVPAEWLFTLPQWDGILSEERREEIYKNFRNRRTVVNGPKVGRNDPCPCGSGKKYKKCCGR
jgi:uncharacterized protein YecA (UPF0149 family)